MKFTKSKATPKTIWIWKFMAGLRRKLLERRSTTQTRHCLLCAECSGPLEEKKWPEHQKGVKHINREANFFRTLSKYNLGSAMMPTAYAERLGRVGDECNTLHVNYCISCAHFTVADSCDHSNHHTRRIFDNERLYRVRAILEDVSSPLAVGRARGRAGGGAPGVSEA